MAQSGRERPAGSAATPTITPPPAGWAEWLETSPTLRRARSTQVLVVGYRESSIPFSFLNAQRQPAGYSIELCQGVVGLLREWLQRPGLTIKFVAVTSATRIPQVASGLVDMECGVTTNTQERQRTVAFSKTIFLAETRLASRRQDNIQQITQLRGQVVVSTVGTTSMRQLSELNQTQQLDMTIIAGRDDTDSFQILDMGRARAYLMDDVLLRSFIRSAKRTDAYVISTQAFSVEPYGIMLNRQDKGFKQAVDAALVTLFASGKQQHIYNKWFMQPIQVGSASGNLAAEPGTDFNLNLPMSPRLQRVIAQPTDSANPHDYE
ncbi:amino acid ABC transporter substrate-binding protein [Parvibium lacunae]|nr:amino acid ABC transporter substrate-binding protein [Parvibium lacunae]